MRHSLITVLALALAASGCHHAVINTGLTPGSQRIHQPWATSLIGGLVPPAAVDAAGTCSNGVAVVETQRSFLNSVATAVTWGIYAPMTITVTCAAGDDQQDSSLPLVLSRAEVIRALETHGGFVLPID